MKKKEISPFCLLNPLNPQSLNTWNVSWEYVRVSVLQEIFDLVVGLQVRTCVWKKVFEVRICEWEIMGNICKCLTYGQKQQILLFYP
jgi:hypothetical protein